MKYIFILFAILSAFLASIFFILFTQSGNNLLKPYLEQLIQKKLNQDVRIEAFTLKTSFIDLEIMIAKNSKAIINGSFDALSKSFDIDYSIDAQNLQTPYVHIKEPLHVKGKASGNIEKFSLDGIGEAFRSQINFATNMENKIIKDIQINAKNIKIEDILVFLKKPIYTKGVIDIVADIKSLGQNSYAGDSDITIHYGTLNNILFEKDYGIKFPTLVTYRGNIKSNIYSDIINSKVDIFSNIAQINSKKTQFDLTNNVLISDYIVNIINLSLIEKSMQGNILFDGNIKQDKDGLSIDINSNTLGGTIKGVVLNDNLKFDFAKLDLTKISTMFKQPKYSDGNLNLSLDIDDIKSNKGRLVLNVEEGSLHVNELIEIKETKNIKYNFSLTTDMKKEASLINADFDSDTFTLKLKDNIFNSDTKFLEGPYSLHVDDLNKLYFVTQRAIKGDVQVDGKYAYENEELILDGTSSFLDAKTIFNLKNNTLHVKSDDLSMIKVADALYYPKVFDSFASLEADYDLASEKGLVSISALNGKLLKSELTNIVYVVSGFDLSSEIYKDSLLRGVIDKKSVDFSLLMNGLESYFKIPTGHLDLESNEIKGDFDIKIENKDFKGSIEGKLEQPTVKLNSSEYIKHKIDKVIDKNVPEEWKDTAKELLNLFN